MTVRLAIKTLNAIDTALEADQGAKFRTILGTVIPHMSDAYRGEEESFRSHMGASLIGGECGRAIWYGWRWATKPKFIGRILRLFNRGHLEEARFIALLLMIGVQVYQQDAQGKQFRIVFANGHGGGSGDGVGIDIPDLEPGQAAVLEFKTHGEKSFKELVAKGVRDAKFTHYVQMQMYMRKMGFAVALYGAVNKNTDELYLEIVVLDTIMADKFVDRAEKLIASDDAPKKLNESPGFWMCRFCDHKPVCHMKAAPEKNCRTCDYSKPVDNGEWMCMKFDNVIPKELQLTGCDKYEKHSGF